LLFFCLHQLVELTHLHYLVEMHTEVTDMDVDLRNGHSLLLDNGVQEDCDEAGRAGFVVLGVVAVHALAHAVPDEQVDELLGQLHDHRELVEHLQRVRAQLHTRQRLIVFVDLGVASEANEDFQGNRRAVQDQAWQLRTIQVEVEDHFRVVAESFESVFDLVVLLLVLAGVVDLLLDLRIGEVHPQAVVPVRLRHYSRHHPHAVGEVIEEAQAFWVEVFFLWEGSEEVGEEVAGLELFNVEEVEGNAALWRGQLVLVVLVLQDARDRVRLQPLDLRHALQMNVDVVFEILEGVGDGLVAVLYVTDVLAHLHFPNLRNRGENLEE